MEVEGEKKVKENGKREEIVKKKKRRRSEERSKIKNDKGEKRRKSRVG